MFSRVPFCPISYFSVMGKYPEDFSCVRKGLKTLLPNCSFPWYPQLKGCNPRRIPPCTFETCLTIMRSKSQKKKPEKQKQEPSTNNHNKDDYLNNFHLEI